MDVFQVGSKSEANGIAKAGAKMVMAVSCAKVKIFLYTSCILPPPQNKSPHPTCCRFFPIEFGKLEHPGLILYVFF